MLKWRFLYMFFVIFLNLENTKIWVNDVLHYYVFEVKSYEYYLSPIPWIGTQKIEWPGQAKWWGCHPKNEQNPSLWAEHNAHHPDCHDSAATQNWYPWFLTPWVPWPIGWPCGWMISPKFWKKKKGVHNFLQDLFDKRFWDGIGFALFTRLTAYIYVWKKWKTNVWCSLASLPKCLFSRLFSLPSLIAQV